MSSVTHPVDCAFAPRPGVCEELLRCLETILSEAGFVGSAQARGVTGSASFTHDNGTCASVLVRDSGLLTVDIHRDEATSSPPDQLLSLMESALRELLKENVQHIRRLPALRRGAAVERYWPLSDGRLVEYDFERELLCEQSAFQSVRVMYSPQYGNTLLLNGDVNLAESDAVYTQCIMGDGGESYGGRDVLILGGGDGAVLHQLLARHRPRSVTMLEIDEVVMSACRTHLRSVCGDSLDRLSGDTHQIVVGDCVPALRGYVESGTTFDFIINDLTAVPISTDTHHDVTWDFLWLILDLSLKVLRPDGKYLTQGNGLSMQAALSEYERHLQEMEPRVSFSRRTACVPSYLELWVFYTIWKSPQ